MTSAKPLHILLVEDDQIDQMNVKRAFERNKIMNPLYIAENGVEALAMLRDWRLVALYVGFSLVFTYNVFDIVWLGIGLLYYPFQLMFWNEAITAVAITIFYGVIMGLFLKPLLDLLRTREGEAEHASWK